MTGELSIVKKKKTWNRIKKKGKKSNKSVELKKMNVVPQ